MTQVFLAPGPFGAGGQFFGLGGLPLNAGTISTYAAGGTTPLATYTSSAGNVQNANPIVLGTDGRPPNEIWITSAAYRFDLKDALGNLIKTYDNLGGFVDSASLAASTGSGLVGFIQSGTGAVATDLQTEGRKTVRITQYGASPSASAATNATAIANAITAVTATGGDVIVPFAASGYTYNSTIILPSGVRLRGEGATLRWRSTVLPSLLKYTGTGSSVSVAPGVGVITEGQAIDGLHVDGAGASGSVDGLYLNATAAGSTIEGFFCENSAFTNFPRYQVLHDGAVFDVTYRRLGANNASRAADNCVHIQNGVPSQITCDDCFIAPYTAGKWGIYSGAGSQDLRLIAGTVAGGASGAGANGVYGAGGLFIYGTHIEGIAAQTGTIGVQYVGSNGAFISPSSCITWGANIKIGDGGAGAARGWTIAGCVSNFNAGGKGDVWVTPGGSRLGTILGLGFGNGNPTITDERLSSDGVLDVNHLYKYSNLTHSSGALALTSGIAAPGGIVGKLMFYVDTADNHLKLQSADATTRAIFPSRHVGITYGASLAIDAFLGDTFFVTVTDGSAHAFAAPTNAVQSKAIRITVRNTFGAIATATFNAVFKTAGYAAPANGFSTSATFEFDGTNWIQVSSWVTGIPN